MKTFILIVIMLIGVNCFSQQYEDINNALPELIRITKQKVIPIICTDSSYTKQKFTSGTGVLVSGHKLIFIITCEHVVALKDSISKKTIRNKSDIYVNLNKQDGKIDNYKVVVLYSDEKNDFAILTILHHENKSFKYSSYNLSYVPSSGIKSLKELKEGEQVLYIGYPMAFGIESKNYPLSRIGIISQIRSGSNNFIIDGFVQHGHSGSPVFRIKKYPENKQWAVELIGIATSYPNEVGRIYEKIGYNLKPEYITTLNPGFTFVTSMDNILIELRKQDKKYSSRVE